MLSPQVNILKIRVLFSIACFLLSTFFYAQKNPLENNLQNKGNQLTLEKIEEDLNNFTKKKNNFVGIVLYNKSEYEEASNDYYQAYVFLNKIKSDRAVKLKERVLYELAYTNQQLGKFKRAYYFLEQATDLTDSLRQASIKQNVFEAEAKYNEVKEAQKLEVEKSLKQRTQFLFYGSAMAFLAFIILGLSSPVKL